MSHEEALQVLFDEGLRIARNGEPGWAWVFRDEDENRISWWVVERELVTA